MSAAVSIAIGAVVFLVAAKLHGRQLRLERERAGYMHVTFGRRAQNPPFVVALWRRERFIFWPTAAVLAIVLPLLVPLHWVLSWILLPMTIAFVVGALLSARRARVGSGPPAR